MGFVNCEWTIKGAMKPNSNQKISADGQTFDSKLYTFKELNYKQSFEYLNVIVSMKTPVEESKENEDDLALSESSISVS